MPFLYPAMYLLVVECVKTRSKFSVIFLVSYIVFDSPEDLLIFMF